jgi:DNA-binding SARP family transcriptional activator
MSTYAATGTRARSVLSVVSALGVLALLWAFRPSLERLPNSLAEPLTATSLEHVGLVLAWFALALLALAILLRGLRLPMSHRQASTPQARKLDSHPPRTESGTARPPTRCSTLRGSPERSRPFSQHAVLTVSAPVEAPVAPAEQSRVEKADEPPPISVSVLGPVGITGGKRRRRLRGSAQELIAYLSFHPEGATRDQLLEALWPGEDPKRSEQRLWQSTSDVRRVLGSVIVREKDRYVLDRAQVTVDLDELERLLAAATTADAARRRDVTERAFALFTGEPLSGSDFVWAAGEVRRLRAVQIDLLEQVGRARLGAGDPRAALDAAERALAIDALNEGLWCLALEAESALGLREAVAQRYEELRLRLDERLGLEPAKETRALYLRLLGQS